MTYLYIDESGYLGLRKNENKYFIVTCVKIDNPKTHTKFKRIPKEIKQRTLSKKIKKNSELKFSNSSKLIRERFLTRVAKLDIQVYYLIINKKYTNRNLQENLPILYNYLLKMLLEKPLKQLINNDQLNICLDRCMSSSQMDNFENYIKTEFFAIFNKIPKVIITHENSQHNVALQVTDFICGACGYKYNVPNLKSDNEVYFNIIKNIILLEKNDLFKDEK